jgi:hypothetical protein
MQLNFILETETFSSCFSLILLKHSGHTYENIYFNYVHKVHSEEKKDELQANAVFLYKTLKIFYTIISINAPFNIRCFLKASFLFIDDPYSVTIKNFFLFKPGIEI